ncbi:hypothetical protein QVG61_00240 [Thiohalobacter sp. IOR34]|nr:hypothetical protein [Thiohalobacter sp. IOR34]WJW75555.1 hypothetical protein QVG61_00240 [Thiohalobacter sp. IOR34]
MQKPENILQLSLPLGETLLDQEEPPKLDHDLEWLHADMALGLRKHAG